MKKRLFLSISACVVVFFGVASRNLQAQGHWEFGAHYGRWNLNFLGSLIEDPVNDAVAEEVQNQILDQLLADRPGLSFQDYQQDLQFDSSGKNYGLSVRWYPGGRNGSFSLGVSVEKSTFEIRPSLTAAMDLYDTDLDTQAVFEGTGNVRGIIDAMTFHLTVRFDFFPSWVVTPFLTFGAGISTAKVLDDSSLSYDYSGVLEAQGFYQQTYSDENTKTLRELVDDGTIDLPGFLPILEMNFGLKAKITKNIHVLVDVGFFDGFLYRGGLAVRL